MSWRPETLKLVGKGRRNLFVLSAWFTGPSGPDNEEKGTNTLPTWLERVAACLMKWHWLWQPHNEGSGAGGTDLISVMVLVALSYGC